jgi:hypothetical protein
MLSQLNFFIQYQKYIIKHAANPEYNVVAYQQIPPEEKAEKMQDKDV